MPDHNVHRKVKQEHMGDLLDIEREDERGHTVQEAKAMRAMKCHREVGPNEAERKGSNATWGLHRSKSERHV